MCDEEPAQMACRDAEPRAQLRLASLVERTVEDEPHRATDELRAAPSDRLWRAIRAAAQAGPIAVRLRGGRERVRPDVLRAWPGGAPGAAVDAGRRDRREGLHVVTLCG